MGTLGDLCQCSTTLRKKCFLLYTCNLMCLSWGSVSLVLAVSTIVKSLAPSSSFPSIRYLFALMSSPPGHLFFSLNSPSSLHYSSYKRCSGALIVFVSMCWTCSSNSIFYLLGNLEGDKLPQMWPVLLVLLLGMISPWIQDLSFPCVELHKIPLRPILQLFSEWQHNYTVF